MKLPAIVIGQVAILRHNQTRLTVTESGGFCVAYVA
jgi:hypothetical protein